MNALDKLNGFLDKSSPKLATFLRTNWKNQQQAITYKELREAIKRGDFDLKYLQQWQQDYSKFVLKHYYPLAQQAIQTSTQALVSAYGSTFKDPAMGHFDNFIQTKGAQLVREISVTQFGAINTLVRQAALSDTMSVDQLAKAIRPCIGLTQRQAQATQNYYNNLVQQGYTPKQALRMQATYAERMHRRRAATIAQTELAFAYNYGQYAMMEEAINNGLILPGVTKKWYTALDERVCDVCGKIDGQEVPLKENFSIGVLLPPAHPNCRCTVTYNNVQSVPAQPAQQAQPGTQVDPNDPNYQPPTIPDTLQYDPIDFDYVSHNNMGTGQMYQFEDQGGNEYIFKPGQSKSGKPEAFRAYIQEAGYKIQGIVDPDSAVPVGTITIDTPDGTMFGAMQKRITGIDPGFSLKSWQYGTGPAPSPEVIAQLQRENVTDWLLGNYDSHGGNFLLTNDGRLIGVDKEQAFRYMANPGSHTMSYSFHPNAAYGEQEPIYNTLYRKFAHGEIDIDLNNTLTYIKRIEAIPDAEYREIFRNYAEAMHGKSFKAEQLLDEIVARKQGLRSTFEGFYGQLLTERKGVATAFQFADTAVAAATAPLSATTFTAGALQGMKTSQLWSVAKNQGMKYFQYLKKDELIQALTDPTQTAQLMNEAKARALTSAQARVARQAHAAKVPKLRQVEGVTQLSDALQDLDKALEGSDLRGVSLISDSAALEGLQTSLRKVTIDGTDYYELSGKLTHDRWAQACSDISAATAQTGSWQFNEVIGSIDYSKPVLDLSGTMVEKLHKVPTQFIRTGDDILVLAQTQTETSARAMMGQFNIRVQAVNGRDAGQKVQELLRQAKMTDLADDVTAAALDRYKKMRLIWQNDPSAALNLNPATVTDAQLTGILGRLGITQARVDKTRLIKVTGGYFTVADPENVALAQKHGVAYLYHEITSMDGLINAIESGELLSTTHRYGRGITARGMSSDFDMETGGADNVFTRIVFNSQVGKYDRYGWGNYMIRFQPQVLERTDWYAYTSDCFGKTSGYDFEQRFGVEDHFAESKQNYRSSNEVMFRRSLPLSGIMEIRVPESEQKMLIDRLKAKGIRNINGIPVTKLIKKVSDKV